MTSTLVTPLNQTEIGLLPVLLCLQLELTLLNAQLSVPDAVPDMTYNVFGGTLSFTQSINQCLMGLAVAAVPLICSNFIVHCIVFKLCFE